MWFVYILRCRDGSLYTGATNDVDKRFEEHRRGRGGRYTRSHPPLEIVHRERFHTKSRALSREAQIKSLTREQKEFLFQ